MALNVGGAGGPTARIRRRARRVALAALLTVLPLLPISVAQAASPAIRLYIFAGQSNMVGYSTVAAQVATVDPTLTTPSPNVRFWGPVDDYATRWATLQAPTEVLQPASHSGFGPELSAAARLAGRHPRSTIAVVKLARNGTNLAFDWSPGNLVGLYPQLVSRVVTAKRQLEAQSPGTRVSIAGFFWMQGEADALSRRGARMYASNLAKLITSLRSHLNAPDMPFVIARIANLKRVSPAYRFTDGVRHAQEFVASTIPGTHLVSTDGLQLDPSSPIHFSTRGTVDLGRRFASPGIGL